MIEEISRGPSDFKEEWTVSRPKMGAKGIEQGGNNNNNEVEN